MTLPDAAIAVKVDPTNPGQFFACCGLLELADRLWPGAEGWFASGEFHIAFSEKQGTLRELLAILLQNLPERLERMEANGLEIPEIIASLKFKFGDEPATTLILDAWNRIAVMKGVPQVVSNPPWNFWAGNQKSFDIWCGLREVLTAQLKRFDDAQLQALFTQRIFQKGRFGFDPGPAWNALDVGFSLNEHNTKVESSAAVELLAAFGLQRFRPVMQDGRESFEYTTWHVPLAPSAAAAAMSGAITDSQSARYRGCVVSRGQYAALGVSFPIREGASRE